MPGRGLMLDFKYRVFLSVALVLSFSKAAKELSLSQPAVSFQIRHLEEELKVRLFIRHPKRIELTPIGLLLLEEVSHLERESEKARGRLMQKLDRYWGSIVVGASTTIGNFFLPPVLAKFKGKYPDVATRLLVDNTDQVLNHLSDGIIDFAIVEGPVNHKQWATEEAFTDELVVIVPRDFPGCRKGIISAQELSRQPFISREAGSGTRAVVDSLRIGKKPVIPPANVILELGSSTAIKKTVEGGLGVSIISLMTLDHELRLGSLRALRIGLFPMYRGISFIFPRGMGQAALVKDMVLMCREYGGEITAGGGKREKKS